MARSGYHISIVLAITACIGITAGCTQQSQSDDGGEVVLVSIGDSTLTVADVRKRIPGGLAAEDSVSLFSSIVESWMQDMLLKEMAADNLVDMDRIDRMVADYRNRLIVAEYMRQLERAGENGLSDGDVKAFFEAEKDKMQTSSPLVKGVYIKIAKDAPRLAEVRRWIRSSSKTSLDNIEKQGVASAIEYDRFTDRWVDWTEVAAQIPYSFGDAEEFLQSNRDFETSDRSSTYLLHIIEVLPSGSPMPYEFAAERIRESYNHRRRSVYGRELTARLAEQARKEGRLETPGYDLQTHRVKTIETKNNRKEESK